MGQHRIFPPSGARFIASNSINCEFLDFFFEFYLQNNRRDFFSAAKMGCGMSTEEKEGKARNEEIENQLKRDKMMQRNEIKMLLLGM